MQCVDYIWVHVLQLQSFTFCIGVDEFFHVHIAAANSDNQFVIHYFGIDLLASKHVLTTSNPRNRQVNACLVDILSKHLIQFVTFNRPVCLGLFYLLNRYDFFLTKLVFQICYFIIILFDHSFSISNLLFLGINLVKNLITNRIIFIKLSQLLLVVYFLLE